MWDNICAWTYLSLLFGTALSAFLKYLDDKILYSELFEDSFFFHCNRGDACFDRETNSPCIYNNSECFYKLLEIVPAVFSSLPSFVCSGFHLSMFKWSNSPHFPLLVNHLMQPIFNATFLVCFRGSFFMSFFWFASEAPSYIAFPAHHFGVEFDTYISCLTACVGRKSVKFNFRKANF